MDEERRKREMIKRLGRMEELMTAGERKKLRQAALEKEVAERAKTTKAYDVGSTSDEIVKRLKRMEELQARGRVEQSKKTKKDIWAKLAEQSQKKQSK
jgi:hypothetical protein